MRLVIDGRPNKLIADALDISVRTVEVHRARVFEKMDVKSAVELANLLRDLPGSAERGADGHGRIRPHRALLHPAGAPRRAGRRRRLRAARAPAQGMQLAVSSDMLVEGRHFLSTVPPSAWATRRWPSTSATWPPAVPSRWPSRWRWRCPASTRRSCQRRWPKACGAGR
jgi:hypothetical protein